MGKLNKRSVLWIAIILLGTVAWLDFLFHKGKDLQNTDEFVKELKSRNYILESIEDVPKDKVSWFSGNQKMIKSSNMELSVFEFSSEEEAINEANRVSKDGFKINASSNVERNTKNGEAVYLVTYLSWGDNPHFYRSGKLIVLYCGTSLKLQYDLNKILGKQFAGFKWYVPGRKH
ncbi:hypothetical protein NBE98_10900 [Clostridium swellfunianum]|uniref:hypothetical protein n=1 Tax=Clostridium swellfunianum TaxID=1367462 RepID=UPI00202FAC63|nr:hypothetical protein [Clostridium swellfunianum]MCM0648884.1 hypothetical protein [Clostridium swellfunianum]